MAVIDSIFEIQSQIGNYDITRVISTLPNSIIYEVITLDETKFALKIIPNLEIAKIEIAANKELSDCQNVVTGFDFITTSKGQGMFMKFFPYGNLAQLMKSDLWKPEWIWTICYNILTAIAAIHAKGFVHRDIKEENVLVSMNEELVPTGFVCDLGLCVESTNMSALMTTAGTHLYRAPEVLREGMPYGPPVDMWSLGVLLYFLLGGSKSSYLVTSPEKAQSFGQYIIWRLEELGKNIPDIENLRHLISSLLNENPAERPTASEALEHYFSSRKFD
jgi:serine/threonine protein kinase